jgi:uncharacterized protein YhfF
MWPRIDGLRTMELGSPGELRRELNALTRAGTKRATAGLLLEYDQEGEALESVGERLVLVDDDGSKAGVIEIVDVGIVPFGDVDWEFAQDEGEGFTSIDHWRDAHRHFYRRAHGVTVSDDTPIVCLRYRLVPDERTPAT